MELSNCHRTVSLSLLYKIFSYDGLGSQTTVTVGSGATGETPVTLSANHYNAGTQTLADVTFGNGEKVLRPYHRRAGNLRTYGHHLRL